MDAIFAGSFDPFTLGHLELVRRALLAGFDRIFVAVAADTDKKNAPLAARVDMARACVKDISAAEVVSFSGFTTDFARKMGCKVILRGLRDAKDFEFESKLLTEYKKMADIEVLYIITQMPKVSSTAAREAIKNGSDATQFLPTQIIDAAVKLYT